MPVGFVTHKEAEGDDDDTKETRTKMIDCGDDDGVADGPSAACKDLMQLREIVSSESRIQGSKTSIVRNMNRERHEGIFHGTTMAQYSPDETQGIALMHKNCAKWLVHDAIDPEFVNQITWTHYKPFNRTLSETESSDSRGADERGSSVRKHMSVPMHVVSSEPRPPRVLGPGHICEIDVYDSTPHLLQIEIPNVESIERRARLILRDFSLSEAFAQYDRWRTFRFHEGMETEGGSRDAVIGQRYRNTVARQNTPKKTRH